MLDKSGPAPRGAVRFFRATHLPGVLAAALVALPFLSLTQLALHGDPDLWPHLARFVLPTALVQTTLLLAGVGALTAIAGAGSAWLITTFEFPGRAVLLWLLPLPMAIPTYIAAYIYADLIGSPVHTLAGAILIFSAVLYPYVYLAARAMFQTHFVVFTDAARALGAPPWRLLRDITVPMARPALAVGIVLAMLETLNDIGASEYLGVPTLTLSIFTTWLNRGSLGGAAQIAVALLAVVVGLIAIERYGRRGQVVLPTQDTRTADRIVLSRGSAWLCAAACGLPALLGFVIPAAYLLNQVIRRGLLARFDAELLTHALNTIAISAAATALILLIAVAAVMPTRSGHHPLLRMSLAVASFGYAVPGTVLALGLLSPLVAFDETANWLLRQIGMPHVGLLLAGSTAGLVIAYCVRFLTVGIGFVQSGLMRVPSDMDEMAQMLGARRFALFRSIHLPMMRPALWGAALLIFVDCLKELPATLLLRPLNVETLSTYIYQYATRGNFEEGALAALLIVSAGILPVLRLVHLAETAPRAHRRSAPLTAPAFSASQP